MKGRHPGQAPDIDGSVYLSEGEAHAGQMRRVKIVQASDWDLVGELQDEPVAPRKAGRVALKVLGGSSGETRWQ
jgi:ribosomal protein S12 methylthiotransferase